MISYHRTLKHTDDSGDGWETADTLDLGRIAKCMMLFAWSPSVWAGRRLKDTFVSCSLMTLDFDDGEMTVAEAHRTFCDCRHIIGTTRSHQLTKNGNPPCDRFRVVMLFERPITCIHDYAATMGAIRNRYPVDRGVAINPVVWYWPCTEIISIEPDGELWEPVKAVKEDPATIAARLHHARASWQKLGRLPPVADRYVRLGHMPVGCARNQTIYVVSRKLAELGVSLADTLQMVSDAPVDYRGFERCELEQAVTNGHKKGSEGWAK
jgi:hypothetical protein